MVKSKILGVYSICGEFGIEVIDIEYECGNNYAVWKYSDETKIHRAKVYEGERSYFLANCKRMHLDGLCITSSFM